MATIADNLQTLSIHLDQAYLAISSLGGQVPAEKRAGNLSAAVVSIPSGGGQFGMTVPRLKDGHDLGGMLSGNDMVSSVSFPQLSSCERLTFEEAFKNCTNLREVNLPNLISTNGDVFKNAFVNSGVEKIDFPKLTTGRVGFYTGCTNATQLKSFSLSALPEVTMDGYQFHEAFKGCSSLSAVNFHSLTTDNGLRNSFYSLASDDKSLVSVDFSSLQYATGRSSFQYVFSSTGLVSAEFPSLVQVGGQETFRGALGWCTELTSASFPELTGVANSNAGMQTVMKECPKLLSVYMPKLQMLLPTQAMYQAMMGCTSLPDISFPSLLAVGGQALAECFSGCSSLTSVNMPALLSANQNGFYRAFASCDLQDFSLPSLTSTQSQAFREAFRDNHSLTSVSMPSLTSTNTQIFADAFVNCSSLLSVEVGISGTHVVAQGMFANSSSQSSGTRWSLVLGNVTLIDSQAFSNNSSIKVIDFRNCSNVPTLQNVNAFNGVSALTCVIPASLDGTWQSTGNWPTLLANNQEVIIQTEVELPYFTIVNRSNVDDMGVMTWNGTNAIDFSTDNGTTWYQGDDNEITFAVPANGQTMFRHRAGNTTSGFSYCRIRNLQEEHEVKGRIGTLVDDPTVVQTPYTFANMFEGDTYLVDASGLVLDCMAERCYDWMFAYDTSLTAGPQFTSQTAEAYCYTLMFYNCGQLSRLDSPLPDAQVNGATPYYEMFNGANIDSISVEWTSWPEYGGSVATPDWMNPFAQGEFWCPYSLGTHETITRGQSYVPSNYLVMNF